MTVICKPSVNRSQKMVPEGGFEPPTRGFSILLKSRICVGLIVNRRENRANKFNYLPIAVQTAEHTLMKRSTETEKRGLARYAGKPKAERPVNIGLILQGYTAVLPQTPSSPLFGRG